MGTWSADVLGSDTACEVYERVLAAYDGGASLAALAEGVSAFVEELAELPKAHNDALFGLALALWEVGALDEPLRARVSALALGGRDLDLLREASAPAAFLAEREKVLAAFARRIGTPRPKARPRRPPPVQLDTPFTPGVCLGMALPDALFGGAVIVQSTVTASKGSLVLALSSLSSPRLPTLDDLLSAALVGFSWESPYGAAQRLATADGRVGRLMTRGVGYERAAQRAPFLAGFARHFTVVGAVPPFHRVLLGSSGLGVDLGAVDGPGLSAALERARADLADSPHADATPLRDLAERLRA